MTLSDDLLNSLPEGDISQVLIGLHWTAVVAKVAGELRCGLASTLRESHNHHSQPDVPEAGQLAKKTVLDLANFSRSDLPTLRSVGCAAINALLPTPDGFLVEQNAEQVIAAHGVGKRVVLVGRFPFVSRLRDRVGELIVLELNPDAGELPESAAPEVVPSADVVAITAMTFINQTLESLLGLCSPYAYTILLGPSTPLSPVLFDYGIDLLSGSVVTAIEPVLQAVGQGANFRQVHQAGVQLVNLTRSQL